MAIGNGGSIGHVTDDVTWPRKVKVVTLIYLDANMSKTVEDRSRFGSNGTPIGNDIWRIDWSRDRWRHVT